MVAQDKLYTVQDLPNLPDDGKIYELHNGVLIEVPGSKPRQSRLAVWIAYLLTRFIMDQRLGGAVTGADGTFALNTYNTRIPDVGYVTADHAASQDENDYPVGAPDLAVEVVSPSNSAREMQERAGEYLGAGARLVWIIDPETRVVDVYRPGGERIVLSSEAVLDGYDVLPGLSLKLVELFSSFNQQV